MRYEYCIQCNIINCGLCGHHNMFATRQTGFHTILLDPAAQRHGGLGEMPTGSNHHGKDIAQIVARSDYTVTIRRPEAVMSGFVARYFTDAEVRPPKFLHGIEPSQVCRWHPRKRGSRAGVARCEPSPQTAPRMCPRNIQKSTTAFSAAHRNRLSEPINWGKTRSTVGDILK